MSGFDDVKPVDSDFSDYYLHQSVYDLAQGLVPEMAERLGFELTETPDVENLGNFIGHVGQAKTLLDNVASVQAKLGDDVDAVQVAADWVERSGTLKPLNRAFSEPAERPEDINYAIWGGGVANWMLRRTTLTERLDPNQIDLVVLPIGIRVMAESEHQLVTTFAKTEHRLPTESDFVYRYIYPRLKEAGFNVLQLTMESEDGDEILRQAVATQDWLLSGSNLVVGNAPNVIQAAGQYRKAARQADASFDSNGNQLYMIGDTIQVARHGEKPDTHQNPFSALGQIARNAFFLRQQQA